MDYYKLGRQNLDAQNLSAADDLFLTGFAQGDLRCAYGLVALAAISGKPMEQPLEKLRESLPVIESLAEHGDAEACFILGRCHETGSAAPQSLPDTIRWYLQAASLGHADAMFNLGCVYMTLGPEARQLALDQLRQAADHGSREALLALEHHRRSR